MTPGTMTPRYPSPSSRGTSMHPFLRSAFPHGSTRTAISSTKPLNAPSMLIRNPAVRVIDQTDASHEAERRACSRILLQCARSLVPTRAAVQTGRHEMCQTGSPWRDDAPRRHEPAVAAGGSELERASQLRRNKSADDRKVQTTVHGRRRGALSPPITVQGDAVLMTWHQIATPLTAALLCGGCLRARMRRMP